MITKYTYETPARTITTTSTGDNARIECMIKAAYALALAVTR